MTTHRLRIRLTLTALVLLTGVAVGSAELERQIEPLIAQLNSADEFEREKTIGSLAEIGPSAVPSLIRAFESDDLHTRRGAMYVLARIGPAAVAPLLEALEHESPQVRWTAATALADDALNDSFE